MTSRRFGRWTVLKEVEPSKSRTKRYLCLCDCGNKKVVVGASLRRGASQSCGCLRNELSSQRQRGENNSQWAGGKHIDKHGYARLYVGEQKYVGEHRIVMEEMLGRPLLPGETVHHKNGQRSDNREDNLELWITYQPKGQRPADLVEYAKEILRRYDTP
jgi:hypothetical protein